MQGLKIKLLYAFVGILFSIPLYSQAGRGVYRFLDLPVSSRQAAIGGDNVSVRDNDVSFALVNPALLTDKTNGVVGLNFARYLANIKFGSAVYGYNFGCQNYLAFGVQYVDFGRLEGYNEFGIKTDNFTAKDFALYLTYARPITDDVTIGATLKPIFSIYERYSSIGIATDVGIHYNKDYFSAGLLFRNMGIQLKGYRPDEQGEHREPLPFDIQLGVSKRFEHAPLRVSATLNNLQRWDMANYQTNKKEKVSLDGTVISNKVKFMDMAFRHLVLGVEFIPTNNFYLAVGYNHRLHQEMIMEGFKSIAGFSFGGGIKLYKFQVGFGMTQYQVGNFSYNFSISTSLNEFVHF